MFDHWTVLQRLPESPDHLQVWHHQNLKADFFSFILIYICGWLALKSHVFKFNAARWIVQVRGCPPSRIKARPGWNISSGQRMFKLNRSAPPSFLTGTNHHCLTGECSHETMETCSEKKCRKSVWSKSNFQNMPEIDHTPKDCILDWLQHHINFEGTVAFWRRCFNQIALTFYKPTWSSHS